MSCHHLGDSFLSPPSLNLSQPHLCLIWMPNTHSNTTTTCNGAVRPLPLISECHKTSNINKQASQGPGFRPPRTVMHLMPWEPEVDKVGKKKTERKRNGQGGEGMPGKFTPPPPPHTHPFTLLLTTPQKNKHWQGAGCCRGTGHP